MALGEKKTLKYQIKYFTCTSETAEKHLRKILAVLYLLNKSTLYSMLNEYVQACVYMCMIFYQVLFF